MEMKMINLQRAEFKMPSMVGQAITDLPPNLPRWTTSQAGHKHRVAMVDLPILVIYDERQIEDVGPPLLSLFLII